MHIKSVNVIIMLDLFIVASLRQRAPYIPTEIDRIWSHMDIYPCLLVFDRSKPQNPPEKIPKNAQTRDGRFLLYLIMRTS
jgi:hypothetical protein